MKAYGILRKDYGCCPGHDKFPKESYNGPSSKRKRRRLTKIAHSIARARVKQELFSNVVCDCD